MVKDFCNQQVVNSYDENIRKLIPGYQLVHQQILSILQAYIPEDAHILIIGAGTGYELNYLLQAFPHSTFTVTELSQPMLNKAKEYVAPWNIDNRVDFVLGSHIEFEYVQQFDAILSILVAHFIPFSEKTEFMNAIRMCLNPAGIFLSFDLTQFSFVKEAETLNNFCKINGLTDKQVQTMQIKMNDDFYALTTQETLNLLHKTGFSQVHSFVQILCYQGFIAQYT